MAPTSDFKPTARHPALHHLPDRILIDIGIDPHAARRGSWNEYLQQLARVLGPTRS